MKKWPLKWRQTYPLVQGLGHAYRGNDVPRQEGLWLAHGSNFVWMCSVRPAKPTTSASVVAEPRLTGHKSATLTAEQRLLIEFKKTSVSNYLTFFTGLITNAFVSIPLRAKHKNKPFTRLAYVDLFYSFLSLNVAQQSNKEALMADRLVLSSNRFIREIYHSFSQMLLLSYH